LQDTLKSLRYAVRPRVLAKYLGLLSMVIACLALAPLAVSLWFEEYTLSARYLLVIGGLLALGLPTRNIGYPSDIQYNESLTITALAFVLSPLVMSYPMMGSGLTFMDAWFEAVSAITTTGLTTISNLESMPKTFLFARAWMQWYGGLGIVILSVAIVMNHHTALRRLMNPEGESLVTTARTYARRMLAVYVALTVAGLGLLMLLLDNSFYALTYTLAAISTGGFAPLTSSLSELSWQVQISVMLLSLAGAIPFILYYRLRLGEWRKVIADVEVQVLVGIILLLTLLLTLTLHAPNETTWSEALFHGGLLAISAQTATGFTTVNIQGLDTAALGILIVAMVIGGGIGSTAGGFKILRLLILLRFIQFLIQRTSMPPHAVAEAKLSGKILDNRDIERALLLIILFILTIVISWIIFLAYGYAPFPALFEVASATATAGLSSGITSHSLEGPLKFVLSIDMLLGRVEIIALLVVLYPGTWFGKRTE